MYVAKSDGKKKPKMFFAFPSSEAGSQRREKPVKRGVSARL